MRKVIDSNYYDTEELRKYLSKSKSNFAVLCEYAGIESYASKDPVEGQFRTYSVVSNYPKQVIVLKGVRVISRQKCRGLAILKE